MWTLIILSVIQSVMLSVGQMCLKVALDRMPVFAWSWNYFSTLATNWVLLASGILCGGSMVIWMYILKRYPLSQAYPMASMSYIIAMILSVFVLHEAISWNRWLGVGLIMIGCIFVAGK